jgi:hypothetical protein
VSPAKKALPFTETAGSFPLDWANAGVTAAPMTAKTAKDFIAVTDREKKKRLKEGYNKSSASDV